MDQIQLPDPLYQRLKGIAEQQDWSLSEVMRRAAEHFITRFPEDPKPKAVWRFPPSTAAAIFSLIPPACILNS
jgi:hypothetical protein